MYQSDAVENLYKEEPRCQIILSRDELEMPKMHYDLELRRSARESYDLLNRKYNSIINKQVNIIVDILEKEFNKSPEKFEFIKSEYHFNNIKNIVHRISAILKFDKIGIDLTPWGSIIFSVIVNSGFHVQLIYDYTVEDKGAELYFAYFLNKKEMKSALDKTDIILSKLTDFLPIDRYDYISSPQTAAFEESLQVN